jgi:hypothetical protein
MTPKEAYRVGFVTKFAELGYTPAAVNELLSIKQALVGDAVNAAKGGYGLLSGAVGDVLDLAKTSIPYAALVYAGIPLAGGMATGKLHAAMTDTTEEDVKRYKMRDIENAYREETARIRARLQRENWRKNLIGGKHKAHTTAVSEPERHEDLFA